MSQKGPTQKYRFVQVTDGLPENPYAEHWQWIAEERGGQHLSSLLFQVRALVDGNTSVEKVAEALAHYDAENRRVRDERFARERHIIELRLGVQAKAIQPAQDGERFRSIVEKTIQLATARREEAQRLYPPTDGINTGADLFRRSADEISGRTPRPAQQALMEYVASLSVEDAAALVTLHYVGRNFRKTDKPEAALNWQRKAMRSPSVRDTALMKVMERVEIDEHLRKGLEVAAAMGLDIEELPRAK